MSALDVVLTAQYSCRIYSDVIIPLANLPKSCKPLFHSFRPGSEIRSGEQRVLSVEFAASRCSMVALLPDALAW